MSTAFSKMKKSRGASLDKLKSRIDKDSGNVSDERFWKLTTDKASNGYAEIRFLQPTDGEDFSYVKRFHHAFKVNGKWFWKNCPTSIGDDCPICEANSKLWETDIEANKTIVRKRKRQTKYIANILVINDTAVPENNGKVFLFEFGKKIFDKILDKTEANPAFPDEIAFNPFDFWEGASFKLKCRKVEGYANYDKSEFSVQTAIASSDTGIEDIWAKQYKIDTFIAPSEFDSYDKLKTEFDKVLGNTEQVSESIETESEPIKNANTFTKPGKNSEPELNDTTKLDDSDKTDEDDEMAYYENMLDD